jgi:hypothetical protein
VDSRYPPDSDFFNRRKLFIYWYKSDQSPVF